MGKNKDRHAQGMSTTPPMGEVERPPSRHQRPCRSARLAEELGAGRRDPEHHLGTRQPVFGVTAGVPRQEALATVPHGSFGAIVWPSDKPVQRHRVPRADFSHGFVLLSRPLSARSMLALRILLILSQWTSQNSVRAKFAEFLFCWTLAI